MSKPLITAAVLMALTAALHVIGGGADVYQPLLATQSTAELSLYLGLLWHFITVFFILGAVAFGWAAQNPMERKQTALCFGTLALAMAGLFLFYGMARVGDIWTAPQWSILLLIGALALWPAKRPT